MQHLTDELEVSLRGEYTMKTRCEACGEWHVVVDVDKIFWYAQFVVKACPQCHPEKTYLYDDNPTFWI